VLLEVETDKTVVEVPALEDGTLARQLVQPGETVALGQAIAETEGGEAARPSEPDAGEGTTKGPGGPAEPVLVRSEPFGRVAASPRARRLAREAGIDLAAIVGTGRRGRIGGDDVARSSVAAADRAVPELHVRRLDPTGTATGAPLVLLHGLFDSGRGWRDLPDRLARAGRTVLAVDLPGHGQSMAGDGTLEGAEAAVERALPAGPVGLVGHSLGAILAARVAARLGERLERLVLVAPAGLGARMDPDFLDLMANAHTTDALARALARLGPGAGPWSREVLASELARLEAGREGMVAMGRAVARGGVQQTDIAPVLERIGAPITAVFGLADPIIDWRDCSALPARAAIHLIREAGHLPHAARPDLVAELILGGAARGWPG
jgi:pyruvate dehydrogenase E2 component (dihydrolipoamide acetyltransferase)